MLRKSIYSVFAVLFIAVAFSCSKDSDSRPDPVQAALKGVWEPYIYTYEGNSSTIYPDDFEFTEFTGFGLELNFNLTFEDEPNAYSLLGAYLLEHTSVHEGNEQSYIFFDVFEDEGTWSREGNIITLFINGEEVTAGISELTETTLILRINRSTSVVGEDNFTTTTTNKNESFHFQRVSF